MTREEVRQLQRDLNARGADLVVDGLFGPKTEAALAKYGQGDDKPQPTGRGPKWYLWAKQYAGKREQDSKFNKFLSGFWKFVGLPGYSSISGKARAWCGLLIATALLSTGYGYMKNGAGARNWAKYAQKVEWQRNGIPRGAIMHINSDCSSGSGNHVTMADGDCTAADLLRPGASVPGFGGNQGDTLKRSMYPVKNVCAVRWPDEEPLPGKVLKSVDCAGKSSGNESTR
jgi:hypothetical protein